jgi:hypothetical protein
MVALWVGWLIDWFQLIHFINPRIDWEDQIVDPTISHPQDYVPIHSIYCFSSGQILQEFFIYFMELKECQNWLLMKYYYLFVYEWVYMAHRKYLNSLYTCLLLFCILKCKISTPALPIVNGPCNPKNCMQSYKIIYWINWCKWF